MFPAPAGINRRTKYILICELCVPRASGDKPPVTDAQWRYRECSPRQRG
ncbi:hypothetical protein ECTHROOPD_3567 [Escherichia coli ThroopD]|nr:hypothetical protein ECTHROOPD_3567 [Escherichia coli ThroopD]